MQSNYQNKLRNNRRRADSYGSWNNGVQIRSERINGKTLMYDHRKMEWK